MKYNVAPTGEFTGSGNVDPKTRNFDVRYRLVSNSPLSSGEAWGIAWNQIALRYPIFRSCRLRTVSIDGKSESWGQCFDITAGYGMEEQEEDPWFASISFSTRGGREKKIHSFATKSYPAFDAKLVPPDFKHGIGFNNGVFEGVDVVVPSFGFSLEADLPAQMLPNAMISYMHILTGKTNFAPFWIFQQGECLFTGMTGNSYRKPNDSGTQRTWDLWYRVSFEFQAQPSLKDADVSPFQGIEKKGMEYLWVFHQDKKDETSGISIPVPTACYVEQVYPYGDFSWFTNLRF